MHKSNNKRSESKFNSKVLKQLRMIQSSSITKGLKFFGSAIGVQKFLLGTTVAAVAWAGCVSCHKSYVNSNFVKQPMLTCLTEEGDADIDKLKKTKKLKSKTVKKRHTSQKTSKPKGSKAGKKGPKLRLKRLEAQGLASEVKELKKARKKPHNPSRELNPIKRRVCLPSKAARTRSKSKACVQPSLDKKRKQKEELKKFKIENGKQLEKALHKLNLSNKKALMKLQQELTKKLKSKIAKKQQTSQKTSKPKGSKSCKKGPKLRLKRPAAQGLASEVKKLKKARKKPHNPNRALNPIKRRVCLPSKAARTGSKSKACVQPSLERVRLKKRKQKEELKKFKIENGKQLEKAVHKLNLSNKKALMKLQQELTKKLKNKTVKKRHTSQKTSKPKGSKASKKGPKLRLKRLEAQGLASKGKLEKARKKPHNPSRALNPIKRRVCAPSKAARTRSKSKACVQPSLERVRFKKRKSVNPKLIQRWLKLLKLPFFAKLAEEYLNKNLEKKSNKNNISNTVEAEKVYEIAQNDSDLKLEAKEVEQLKDAFKTHKSKKLEIKEFEYFFKKTDCDVEQLDCYCRKLGTFEEQKVAYGCSDKSNMVEFKNMLWIKLNKTVLGVSLEPNGGPGKGRVLLDMGCIGADFFKEEELAENEIEAKEKVKEVVKREVKEGSNSKEFNDYNCNFKINNETNNNVLMCQENCKNPGKLKEQEELAENEIEAKEVKEEEVEEGANSKEFNDYNCNSKINNETNNNAFICQENCKNPGKLKEQEELAGNEIGAKKEVKEESEEEAKREVKEESEEEAKREVKEESEEEKAKEEVKEVAKILELDDDEIKQTESHPEKILSAQYSKAERKKGELSISSYDADDYAGDNSTCDESNQEEEFNVCNCNFKINNETNNNVLICQENCKNPGKLKKQEELAGNEIEAKEGAKEVKEEAKGEAKREVKEKAKEVKEEAEEEAKEVAKILELDDDEIKQTESHPEKILSAPYLKADQKNVELSIYSAAGDYADDYAGDMPTCDDSNQEEESNDYNYNSKINNETNNNGLMCQENCKNPGKLKKQEELAENEIEAKEKAKEAAKEESEEKAKEAAKILELDDDDIKKLVSYLVKILSAPSYSKADQKNVELFISSFDAGDYAGDTPTCDESNQGEESIDHNYNFKINNETNNNAFMCQENLRLFRV